ncbi:glycine-rich protein [Rathayibacter sp. Leaf248]|uniref:glycine-rich protein n=1 Tax=Rathayibacter sp. Leaf248 TaxID=2876555 RepID=UPI001E289EFE|nr:glycine-rich protein [Rathayibacter sp. Leaf248]
MIEDDAAAEVGDSIFSDLSGTLVKGLVSGALGKIGGDAVGWILDSLTGPAGPTPVEQEELDDLANIQSSITQVTQEITALNSTIQADEQALKNQAEQNSKYATYVTRATAANTALGKVLTDIQNVCQISAAQTAAARATGTTGALDLPQKAQLQEIVTNGQGRLNDLDTALAGTPTDPGVFAAYRDVLWASKASGSFTPSGTILSAELANSMQSQAAFYAGVATLHLQAFTEAVHAPESGATSAELQFYYEDSWVPAVQRWSHQASSNLPTLPAGTSADLSPGASPDQGSETESGTIRLWTTEPTVLAGTDQDRYCMYPSTCYAPVWAADDNSDIMLRASVVPAVAPLRDALAVPQKELPGWRIPTEDDFDSLVATRESVIDNPSSGVVVPRVADGVGAWAAVEDVPALKAQSITVPSGTFDTVLPVVVDSPFSEVLVFNGSPYSEPEQRTAGDNVQGIFTAPDQKLGGQLMLVQDLPVAPPQTPPFPESTTPAPDSVSTGTPSPDPSYPTRDESDEPATAAGDAVSFPTPSACAPDGNRFTQPTGYNAVSVSVSGGSGGTAFYSGSQDTVGAVNIPGGSGGSVSAVIPVVAGTQLYIGVGGRGESLVTDGESPDLDSGAGQGGVGNGGNGGSSTYDDKPNGGAPGGGGLSVIALDEYCQLPLVVGGGGGGAGPGGASNTLSAGGNSCITTGCDGGTGNKSDVGVPSDYFNYPNPGGGTLAGGGAGTAANGDAGNFLIGGFGATPPGQRGDGPGGGGGAGFFGGGGGGAGLKTQTAGGGAGGSSFVVEGALSSSFTLASPVGLVSDGSVTITPVVASDFSMSYQLPAPDSDTSYTVRHDYADPQAVIALPTETTAPQYSSSIAWAALTQPFDGTQSDPFGVHLVDTASGSCATATETDHVVLTTCSDGTDDPAQRWSAVSASGVTDPDLGYLDYRSATGVSFTTAVDGPTPGVLLVRTEPAPPLTDAVGETPERPTPTPTTPRWGIDRDDVAKYLRGKAAEHPGIFGEIRSRLDAFLR